MSTQTEPSTKEEPNNEEQILDEITGEPRRRTSADAAQEETSSFADAAVGDDDGDVNDEEMDLLDEEELFEEEEEEDLGGNDKSPVRRNPARTRRPTPKGRRAMLKENRQPVKLPIKIDFDLAEKAVAPGKSSDHPFSSMPKEELLVKYRNLEFAHQRLVEDAKKQQKELTARLSAANGKHSKAVFRVKAMDAENRALKKHIREKEYLASSTPVPKITLKGHGKARLQIMRGTQSRVRDWTYLSLPVDPTSGLRVGEMIFSEDEAEELKVMKDRRGGPVTAKGGRGKGARKRKASVRQEDDETLQEQMLAEAERAVQDKTNEERETVTATTSASGKITIVEDDAVPQAEKVIEIQATPSAPLAVKRPAFFPKAMLVVKSEPANTNENTNTAILNPQQQQQQHMVQTVPAGVLATAQQQQHVVQQQQQQQHQLQQHHVVQATPTTMQVVTPSSSSVGQTTTTIQIPASALANIGHHGHHQLLTVQGQQLQQHADPQQQQQVVYLLNADAGADFSSGGEILVKDGTKTWTL